jgi:hypothetical protein
MSIDLAAFHAKVQADLENLGKINQAFLEAVNSTMANPTTLPAIIKVAADIAGMAAAGGLDPLLAIDALKQIAVVQANLLAAEATVKNQTPPSGS